MFAFLTQGSPLALGFLSACLILVLLFEISNGFHDSANAVATVIYTHSLKPVYAVVWSGIMNFLGVILGGIAVAYALVELIPPDVLSPRAEGRRWGCSPHCTSPRLCGMWELGGSESRIRVRTPSSARSSASRSPVWWMRGVLILTCTGVSFAHGTNAGQKSIGLIMLAIIGLLPAAYALNMGITGDQLARLAKNMPMAASLIDRYGDDQKTLGVEAARKLGDGFGHAKAATDIPEIERPAIRNDLNRVLSELKTADESKTITENDKKSAKTIHDDLKTSVQYAPWWVRILSALCLGAGTMIGYKRIVKTLGERLGKQHLAPAQGASAELVAAVLISGAGFTGYPVSTTHVVTSGITGTMVASGAGVQPATIWQITTAWILTLPATITLSACLFYILS